jgi:PDZ domain-containing protein
MTPWDPEPPSTYEQPRIPWWPVAIGIAVIVSLIVGLTMTIPYYAIAPGGALSVAPLVHVEDGPSYAAKGEILLCTVSLKRTTVMEALQGWLDPTIDVVKEQQIVPREVGRKKLHEFNLQLMVTSKQSALAVAFQELGYDVIKGHGAQIVAVVAKTPAAGVVKRGDVIEAVDGAPTNLDADAVRVLRAHSPGDTVHLTVRSRGAKETHDVTAVLTKNPDHPKRAFLGVQLQTYKPKFDFPYKVDLESERIGGPSAGLAFTLEVLDVLTEGELTGGHRVAATGTIELDGTVGEVGGVAQKTVAVKASGAELFLVPTAELKAARKFAGNGLRVEPVRNLRDALRILAGLGGNGLALDRNRPGT